MRSATFESIHSSQLDQETHTAPSESIPSDFARHPVGEYLCGDPFPRAQATATKWAATAQEPVAEPELDTTVVQMSCGRTGVGRLSDMIASGLPGEQANKSALGRSQTRSIKRRGTHERAEGVVWT